MNKDKKKLLGNALVSILLLGLTSCATLPVSTWEEPLPQRLEEEVLALMQGSGVRGLSLAVVDLEKGNWSAGFGVADDQGRPVNPNTLFRPGSISKVFTAMALVQALEESDWDLDSPIGEILGEDFWDTSDSPAYGIPPRQILTHHSGLPADKLGHLFPDDPLAYRNIDEHFAFQGIQSPPGTIWNYSNAAFALAGVLIDKITGTPFPDYIKSRILDPLGMKTASYDHRATDPGDLSMGFRETGIPFFTISAPEPMIWSGPAGGLSASAQDMESFMETYLTSSHPLDFTPIMEEDQITGNPMDYGRQMGLGWILDKGNPITGRTLFHNGGTAMFFSYLKLLPDQGLGVYVSINTNSAKDVSTMVGERILKILLEDKPRVPLDLSPEAEVPWEENLDDFLGVYHHGAGLLELSSTLSGEYQMDHPVIGLGRLNKSYSPGAFQLVGNNGENYSALIVFFVQGDQKYLGELVGGTLRNIAPMAPETPIAGTLDETWLGEYRVKEPERFLGDWAMDSSLKILKERGGILVDITQAGYRVRNLIVPSDTPVTEEGFDYRLAGFFDRYNGSRMMFRLEDGKQVIYWMGLKFER